MKKYSFKIICLILLIFLSFPTNLFSNKFLSNDTSKFDEKLNAFVKEALILFERGKFELTERNIKLLNELAVMLKDKKFAEKTLAIHGHTDTTGTARGFNNLRLSEQRARAVYDYLLTHCEVLPDRIAEVVGWGILKPVDKGGGRDSIINRSVQFYIDHQGESHKFDNVIPEDYQVSMEKNGMRFYKGNNPPKIEGYYLIGENSLWYSSDNKFQKGQQFADDIISFKYTIDENNQMIIEYVSECGRRIKKSRDVRVIGDGNKFSAYFNAEGTNAKGIYSKTANVISGEITSKGIKNIQVALLMLEKSGDIYNELMEPGQHRIFIDADGLAEFIHILEEMKSE